MYVMIAHWGMQASIKTTNHTQFCQNEIENGQGFVVFTEIHLLAIFRKFCGLKLFLYAEFDQ